MMTHVVIVDRDPGAAAVTRGWLQRLLPGVHVTWTTTLAGGFGATMTKSVDLLILDPLPNQDCGTFLQTCRSLAPDLEVIVLASAPTAWLRRQVEGWGVALYGEKPAPLEQWSQQVTALLNKQPLARLA